jgi:4-alpha-glucanotransferase
MERASGILLHPTSLPGRFGIGELGQEAYAFIDFLKKCEIKLWQILPLNPVGYGESPYQCFSAFAGNFLLISLAQLQEEGLLHSGDLDEVPPFPANEVDYGAVMKYKEKVLKKAFLTFSEAGTKSGGYRDSAAYRDFVEKNSFWLNDYALFMAFKEYFNYLPWNYWSTPMSLREPQAIKYWQEKLKEQVDFHIFLQYKFFSQWNAIKAYSNQNGIKIIGDLPLYVAYDSSDAWVYPRFFELDAVGNPLKVGGVPPDYFSATGQLWGNPVYKWDEMAKDDYKWWRERIEMLLSMTDIIRVDHFRGFEAYWEVPGKETTAVNGRWVKGPGERFFSVISKYMGELPLIAEDLGVITPEVVAMKNKFNFPGMKILQFVNSEPVSTPFDNGNYVYYTGTHDNDTLLGWYKKNVLPGLHDNPEKSIKELCWELTETVYQSRADWVIIPLQDLLCLDSWARMNTPGTIGGNWKWRLRQKDITSEIEEKLAALAAKHHRN